LFVYTTDLPLDSAALSERFALFFGRACSSIDYLISTLGSSAFCSSLSLPLPFASLFLKAGVSTLSGTGFT
jgi:hypothetical protein